MESGICTVRQRVDLETLRARSACVCSRACGLITAGKLTHRSLGVELSARHHFSVATHTHHQHRVSGGAGGVIDSVMPTTSCQARSVSQAVAVDQTFLTGDRAKLVARAHARRVRARCPNGFGRGQPQPICMHRVHPHSRSPIARNHSYPTALLRTASENRRTDGDGNGMDTVACRAGDAPAAVKRAWWAGSGIGASETIRNFLHRRIAASRTSRPTRLSASASSGGL
jgi:hypothetical protein